MTVLAVGLLFGQVFRYFGQPTVIGEVFAGILWAPRFLGQDFSALILPQEIAPYLGMIAQLGVILFMFLVGVEVEYRSIAKTRACGHGHLACKHRVAIFCAGGCWPFLC